MAITKLVSPNTSVPVVEGDWALAMAQMTALKTVMSGNQMVLTQWTNTSTLSKLANGAYIHHLGAIYVVDTEDFAITVPAADGTYYIRIVDDGADSLDVDFVTDISGYNWNPSYNGMYHNDGYQVLPYQIAVSGTVTVFTKRKILNFHRSTGFLTVDYLGNIITATILGGAVVCSTIDTGFGAVEVGQNLRTTDNVEFNLIRSTFNKLSPLFMQGNIGSSTQDYFADAVKTHVLALNATESYWDDVYLACCGGFYTTANAFVLVVAIKIHCTAGSISSVDMYGASMTGVITTLTATLGSSTAFANQYMIHIL